MKFGRLWRIAFALQTVVFHTPKHTLNTLPILGPRPFNCQCFMSPHKAVCTPPNLHWWSAGLR